MSNPELELAQDFVENTSTNIFLTGRAGTGKTTFLQNIRKKTSKRLIVVAPTGVAAINAKGETIHSFFQLPFSPFIPGVKSSAIRRFTAAKINIIRSLDLIIIDEISMVRADTLDAIDQVMRRFRDREKPFGGAQLLLIGDLQQLPPVVVDNEWDMLREHYSSPYFIDSHALKSSNYACIELKHIYRQSHKQFINLLEKVRTASLDKEGLELLNSRYIPDFKADKDKNYITLSSHNHSANTINQRRLEALKAKEFTFEANIVDNFPEYSYPAPKDLQLKLGAQVMFTKNDSSPEKRYVNGTIGIITALEKDKITVLPTDSGKELIVEKAVWENTKYTIDELGEITETIEGTFTQYPLRTAWAITIHKSQGLTFDYAMIDAADAFSHGQVYVALSRCRTLEGMVLLSKLGESAVISDYKIKGYMQTVDENPMTSVILEKHKKNFLIQVLCDVYGFSSLEKNLSSLRRLVRVSLAGAYPKLALEWSDKYSKIEDQIFVVGTKFCTQIKYILNSEPVNQTLLIERIDKAATYFKNKIDEHITPLIIATTVKSDDKEVKKLLKRYLENLTLELKIKMAAINIPANDFTTNSYLKAKAKAILDTEKNKGFKNEVTTSKEKKSEANSDIQNNELFEHLRTWRNTRAKEQGVAAFIIATQKAIIGISNELPESDKELLAIKGIGKVFVTKYGTEILAIVKDYLQGRI